MFRFFFVVPSVGTMAHIHIIVCGVDVSARARKGEIVLNIHTYCTLHNV